MKKLIFIVVLASLAFSGCISKTVKNEDWVFTVNDENVPEEEFKIYMYETQKSFEQLGGSDIWETDFDGRTAESVAKENTFNTVVMVKIAAQKAKKESLDVNDETKDKINKDAAAMFNEFSESIKNEIGADEQLYYNVLYENKLYSMVYEDTVKDYTVSDDEFQNFYSANKEELTQYYMTNVNSEGTVDEEVLRDYSYSYFEESKKQQYFAKEYDKWKAGSIIKKNQDVWNKISLIK